MRRETGSRTEKNGRGGNEGLKGESEKTEMREDKGKRNGEKEGRMKKRELEGKKDKNRCWVNMEGG